MRDWLLKGVDEEVLLRTVASSITAMVDRLAEDPADASAGGRGRPEPTSAHQPDERQA